jgi:hypothetical protein
MTFDEEELEECYIEILDLVGKSELSEVDIEYRSGNLLAHILTNVSKIKNLQSLSINQSEKYDFADDEDDDDYDAPFDILAASFATSKLKSCAYTNCRQPASP